MTDEQKPQLPAIGGRPQAIIPTDLDSVYRLATAISKSGIAPRGMSSPEQIMVAILHGAEIGLPPMASVQRIAVIGGRATIWGDAALGLIMASPAYEEHEEAITGEGDARTAICTFHRKGKKPKTGKFSVADAKRAGLWSPELVVKKKDWDTKQWVDKPNDSPWHRFPDRMLQMRARGFAGRDAFPDVLGGLYLQEEMEGIDAADVTPRASYGPPSDPPPPEIEHKPGVPMNIGAFPADWPPPEIEHKPGVPMNTGAFPADGTPILNPLPDEIPAKRKRATKAEMEARRAAQNAGRFDRAKPPGYPQSAIIPVAMEQIKEGVEANLPPEREIGCADSMLPEDDIPMPPEGPPPVNDNVPSHILATIATYKAKLAVEGDPEALDTLWAVHITPIEDQLVTFGLWEACAAADDRRRGEMEIE